MSELSDLLEKVADVASKKTVERTLATLPDRVAYTVTQTSVMFGCSPQTIHRMIAQGLLWTVDTGCTKVLIPKRSIQQRLDEDEARNRGVRGRLRAVEAGEVAS